MTNMFHDLLGRKRLTVAAGVALASVALGGTAQALLIADGDKPAPEKTQTRTVKIITAGEPITVERSGGKITIETADVSPDVDFTLGDEAFQAALERVENALNLVTERLKKTRQKDERKALEAARDGLETALNTLNAPGRLMPLEHPKLHSMHLDEDELRARLMELEVHEGEIEGLRFRIEGDIEAAKAEIAEAMAGLDVEIDSHGNMKNIRIRSLQAAQQSLAEVEQRELEAIKRAEERLAKQRERLEKRMEERKAREAEDRDGGNKG